MANTTTTFVREINSVEINQVGVVTSTFNIGARGLSAYEQAVDGGYEGTLSQFELDLASIPNKVDKVDGKSLVDDSEIDKLAEYPEYEDLEFSHENLTDKNSEASFQHVDERINEIPAEVGASSYTLLNRRQTLITGTLPNGVNSTLILPALVAGERNEVILHFKTNATAAPTLVYSGFTPVWLNGSAISMKVNKQYTIVFEQINGIVKTSWGEY